MMATLRCDHPDIEEFIAAKQQAGRLRRFNLSVLVTDAFMTAVRTDAEWPLGLPCGCPRQRWQPHVARMERSDRGGSVPRHAVVART